MSYSDNAESRWQTWRQWTAPGHAHIQESLIGDEAAARTIRNYADPIISGLLQTERYARGVLRACVEFIGNPDDSEEAVAARMQRQEILHSDAHELSFLLTEQSLYTLVGDESVMREQLEYLITVIDSPRLEIGIVPRDTLFVYTTTGFVLHDRRKADVETISAGLTITAPDELEYYEKVWSALHRRALSGDDARARIAAALEHHGGRA